MATIKDVANRAGVSHGTVSNVLNKRGNVSAEKIELVTRVAREMGYQINNQASTLRAGNSTSIACILPDIRTERYQLFYDNFCEEIRRSSGVDVDLYLTGENSDTELAVIRNIAGKHYHCIITISSLSDSAEYYKTLKIAPEHIFFIYQKPAGAMAYSTLDYYQAGIEIGWDIKAGPHDKVSIVCEQGAYQYSQDFIEGVSSGLSGEEKLIIHNTSEKGLYRTAFDVVAENPRGPIIVLDNETFSTVTSAVMLMGPSPLPQIYLLSADEFSFAKNVTPYKMNYGKLGVKLARKICNNDIPMLEIPIKNPGFSTISKQIKITDRHSSLPLNLLILKSPSSEALKKILPHFSHSTGINVNVIDFPYEDINNVLSQPEARKNYDILRIDMATLPWLGRQIFMPLDDIFPDYKIVSEGFENNIMDVFGKINDIRYAVPFDPGAQLLFYRKDIFNDTILSRLFYEQSGTALTLPSTFDEFDRLLRFFSSVQPPGPPRNILGTTMTTGSTILIATEYLTRYYSLGGLLLHENYEANLELHKATLALEGYIAQLAISLNLRENWWNKSVNLFQHGGVAMQISYMNQFNHAAQGGLASSLGYATVPGGVPQLGGGVIGISRYSKNPHAAALFLEWFYSEEIFEHWVLLGGNGAQKSSFRNHQIVGQYPWLTTLSNYTSKGIRETCFSDGTPFNLRHAEHIIGMGISSVINSTMSIPEAITNINQALKGLDFSNSISRNSASYNHTP
ncbi:extracellular solute-binding protein [Serratia entomophila]|uniref:extracellular solute-binding protein n=1 Tax=Serratia entomophila TaxID=42906 RepID=UPI0021778EC0|nr:extracellular solute-binding protein [Serratia entomophila]CAI1058364.1 Catabolite repressor/activator [Serratia entomophila]CAI1790701.1 Catabolite repressor/activator [Serratia entomophila]CAI1829829.1 Catabolite repressor/activator [Serratia entomophila]CAI1844508.1 Catabolite repressor/activator [Serratia entomophila]CAI1914494.1 Catabolite repressor/activator [Serratia entomophila]